MARTSWSKDRPFQFEKSTYACVMIVMNVGKLTTNQHTVDSARSDMEMGQRIAARMIIGLPTTRASLAKLSSGRHHVDVRKEKI